MYKRKSGGEELNLISWLIVACEIAFWVVILVGLTLRYVFKRKKLSLLFFTSVPLIDLILLVVAGLDIYFGAKPTAAHAIAAVYIGSSIAFGKSMIAWLDEKFRYYIMKDGSKPVKRYGMEFARHGMKSFGQHVFAYIIGALLLFGMILITNNHVQNAPFYEILQLWTLIIGIDFVISISYFIWPKRSL